MQYHKIGTEQSFISYVINSLSNSLSQIEIVILLFAFIGFSLEQFIFKTWASTSQECSEFTSYSLKEAYKFL